MYYSLIGCFITILIGWTISYFTGSESDLYDGSLVHPIARKMADMLPGKKRQYAEKTIKKRDVKNRNGSTTVIHPSPSVPVMDVGKSTGSLNPTFTSDNNLPMENVECYKTKL